MSFMRLLEAAASQQARLLIASIILCSSTYVPEWQIVSPILSCPLQSVRGSRHRLHSTCIHLQQSCKSCLYED